MSWNSPLCLLDDYDFIVLQRSVGEVSGSPAVQELKLAVRKKSDGSYARFPHVMKKELRDMGYLGVDQIPDECFVAD